MLLSPARMNALDGTNQEIFHVVEEALSLESHCGIRWQFAQLLNQFTYKHVCSP